MYSVFCLQTAITSIRTGEFAKVGPRLLFFAIERGDGRILSRLDARKDCDLSRAQGSGFSFDKKME